jgi:hypothetical protein
MMRCLQLVRLTISTLLLVLTLLLLLLLLLLLANWRLLLGQLLLHLLLS